MSDRVGEPGVVARFLVGAALGVFCAFWLALVWAAADRHFALAMLACGVGLGVLAQLPLRLVQLVAEKLAPYLGGLVLSVVFLAIVSSAWRLRTALDRCERCCESAGYAAMVYASEYRGGERYCICTEPTDPSAPRKDTSVCINAGRRRAVPAR
jgi:hypothetical protein